MKRTEMYRSENRVVAGVMLKFTTYKNGESYRCIVSKLNPGGSIARTVGKTREQAEQLALSTVKDLLGSRS